MGFFDGNNNKKGNDAEADTFHRAISPVLTFMQILGAMPVFGIRNPDPSRVNFRWISPAVLFGFIVALICVISHIYSISSAVESGLNIRKLDAPSYYFSVLWCCMLFLRIATQWPKLIQLWTKVDLIFLRYPYSDPKMRLSRIIPAIAVTAIVIRWSENILFWINDYYDYILRVDHCNISHEMPQTYQGYMNYTHPYYVQTFGYNIFSVVVYEYLLTSFCSYGILANIFVTMVSIGIITRFQQFNGRVKKLEGLYIPEKIWREIRGDFIKICELLEAVDDSISSITLYLCGNDIYFICIKFLNILTPNRPLLNYIYFWYSMLFAIIRAFITLLLAAMINEESKLSLLSLHKIPSKFWCSELDRLAWQIHYETVALSGMKFFYITKKLLIGLAGTIFTYELVLLQIDEPSRKAPVFVCDPIP